MLSSAGLVETLGLVGGEQEAGVRGQGDKGQESGGEATAFGSRLSALASPLAGQISFNEAIFVLDCQPRESGA